MPSLSKITGLISVKIGVQSMAGAASQPPHDSPAPPAVSVRIPWNGFSSVFSLAIFFPSPLKAFEQAVDMLIIVFFILGI